MSQTKFEQLADLLDQVQFSPASREGALHVADATVLADLRAIVDDEELGLTLPEDEIDDVAVGDNVAIELLEPRLGIGIFATTFDDFLRAPSSRIKRPNHFYILDLHYNSLANGAPPELVSRYDELLKLISIFRETATYVDEPNATLVYLGKDRFDIQIRYTVDDIEKLDATSLKLVIDSITTQDNHREQKLAILGQSLKDSTKNVPDRERFSYILNKLSEIRDSYVEGYSLFAASFSYSKIKNELESAKVEYIGKIHKAITDIQNQLLGLPIATVIVATQMKEAKNIDAQFWTNCAVLAGAWIFVFLLSLLLRNQFHTLDTLYQDIEKQRSDLENKYSSIAKQFRDVFGFLKRRLCAQRLALWTIAVVAVIAAALATFFFFMLTQPAYDWFHRLVAQLPPS
ncbi:hypothetical protein [Burkholderia multivorans]|uniref:hypothetical protein n=1 Tax=Burkholderia multivorans TaxID=87883 RepID=UPI001C226483|nr:hypothetical protein [Burkholderia multivorans]MBU9480338.1 hypothetical protein [Burkholderia multivorans]